MIDKTLIGLLFILAGIINASMAFDDIYNHTLGLLVKYDWVRPPKPEKLKGGPTDIFGRKPTIFLYSAIFIIIGVFILWNRNS